MAAKKKAAKKAATKVNAKAAKAPKEPKEPKVSKFAALRIVKHKDNPLREGSSAHTNYGAMAAFMKKKPTATVADVFAGTTYTPKDFRRDSRREHISVK